MSGRHFSSVFASTSSTRNRVNLDPRFIILQSDYTINSPVPIGEGGCSSVFVGNYKNKNVAVKRFKIDNVTLPVNANMLLKEAEELLSLNHSNVIKCIAVCPSTGSLLLEYAVKTIWLSKNESYQVHSLRQLLDAVADDFPVPLKFEACYQILNGLQYIHTKKVIHGDLKSANVLVTGLADGLEESEQFFFKLTDLGQAHTTLNTKLKTNRTLKTGHVNKAGTVSFEAPEIFENFPKNEASDVYSFGMLMYELLFPSIGHPWESVSKSSNPQVVSASIMQAVKCGRRPPVEDSLSNDHFIVTMKKCWDEDPKNRPLERANVDSIGDEDYEDQCDIVAESEAEESEAVVDEYVGLSVWIDCKGENGTSLGWFEGVIESKTKKDEYLVRLTADPEYYAILTDLFDENQVRFEGIVPN